MRIRRLDVEASLEDSSVALRVGGRRHETATAPESERHLSDLSVQDHICLHGRQSLLRRAGQDALTF